MARPRNIGTRVKKMLLSGKTYVEIARRLECSKGTVSFHAKNLGVKRKTGWQRYDWKKIQGVYDKGNSVRKCMKRFGFSMSGWDGAVKRGDVCTRGQYEKPLEEVLVKNSSYSRTPLKTRLLKAGLLKNKCSICGITKWKGKRLVMRLDHINGVNNDHRRENLRMVCPNCDSQLDTFCARNMKNGG